MRQVKVLKTTIQDGKSVSREMVIPESVWETVRKQKLQSTKYTLLADSKPKATELIPATPAPAATTVNPSNAAPAANAATAADLFTPAPPVTAYDSMPLSELRAAAEKAGIQGYKTMGASKLVSELKKMQ